MLAIGRDHSAFRESAFKGGRIIYFSLVATTCNDLSLDSSTSPCMPKVAVPMVILSLSLARELTPNGAVTRPTAEEVTFALTPPPPCKLH